MDCALAVRPQIRAAPPVPQPVSVPPGHNSLPSFLSCNGPMFFPPCGVKAIEEYVAGSGRDECQRASSGSEEKSWHLGRAEGEQQVRFSESSSQCGLVVGNREPACAGVAANNARTRSATRWISNSSVKMQLCHETCMIPFQYRELCSALSLATL
jgi:hypothetical protein